MGELACIFSVSNRSNIAEHFDLRIDTSWLSRVYILSNEVSQGSVVRQWRLKESTSDLINIAPLTPHFGII